MWILNIVYKLCIFLDTCIKMMKVILALVMLFAVSQASPIQGSAYDLFKNNAKDSVVSWKNIFVNDNTQV